MLKLALLNSSNVTTSLASPRVTDHCSRKKKTSEHKMEIPNVKIEIHKSNIFKDDSRRHRKGLDSEVSGPHRITHYKVAKHEVCNVLIHRYPHLETWTYAGTNASRML